MTDSEFNQHVMPTDRTCPQCGAKLSDDGLSGRCPACLMGLAVGIGADGTEVLDSAETPSPKPEVELRTIRYFGDYELLKEIARGGMGVVYRARQVSLNRPVALKMILAGHLATPAAMQRFQTEAEAAARLDHPRIVPIYEIGEHEGQHYFSMKLIEGGTLAERIAKSEFRASNEAAAKHDRSTFDIRISAFVISKVASAVHYAHQRGILHRDLKPTNILIDERGEPHVADFGLAKLSEDDSSLTKSAAVLGTPSYMAPEQAAGHTKELTTAVDIYSLGAVLYELLTGRPPFRAETALETLRQVCEQEPPRPHALNPQVDRDLETICLKCLNKEPEARYGSAEMLAEDLDHWRNGEPILARPITQWERALKWTKRKPGIAALSGLLLLTIGFGLPAGLWQRRNAVLARKEARQDVIAGVQARERAEQASALAEIQRAEEYFGAGDGTWALAYFARVVRQKPGNDVVAARVFAALTQYSFFVSSTEPLQLEAEIVSARFSPDGRRVATTSADNTARVWDAKTAQPLTKALKHLSGIWSAQFSPDGQRLVTASADKTVRMWDANTGELQLRPLLHQAEVWAAQFSPDGRRIVTASADSTARIWDAQTGQLLIESLKHKRPGGVLSVQFSPDGQRVVTTGGLCDKTARIWDTATGEPLAEPFSHSNAVQYAEFSPDAQRVVTASADGTARIWDAKTGHLLAEVRHAGPVNSAHFSPDGQKVVTASSDKTARVWDAKTGRPLTEPLLNEAEIASAQFSPDGQCVLTASARGTTRIWDGKTGKLLAETKHTSTFGYAQFSSDGRLTVTTSGKTARICEVKMRQLTTEVPSISLPIPEWVPTLMEAISGKRLNDQGFAEPVPEADLMSLKRQLSESAESDVWTRWGKWFFAGPNIDTKP